METDCHICNGVLWKRVPMGPQVPRATVYTNPFVKMYHYILQIFHSLDDCNCSPIKDNLFQNYNPLLLGLLDFHFGGYVKAPVIKYCLASSWYLFQIPINWLVIILAAKILYFTCSKQIGCVMYTSWQWVDSWLCSCNHLAMSPQLPVVFTTDLPFSEVQYKVKIDGAGRCKDYEIIVPSVSEHITLLLIKCI